MSDSSLSRRSLLRTLGAAGGALVMAPVVGCGGGGPDCSSTAGLDAQALATRNALHYAPRATDANRRCELCALYNAPAAGQCGGCQLFQGSVEATGSCDSFAARP